MVHFLESAGRTEDAIRVIKLMLNAVTNPQIRAVYSNKLAILLNNEQSIGKLVQEGSLSKDSSIWLNSISRMYFDRGEDD